MSTFERKFRHDRLGRRRRSVYDKKPQRYTETTEQYLIVRSGKFEVKVTNSKRLGRPLRRKEEEFWDN